MAVSSTKLINSKDTEMSYQLGHRDALKLLKWNVCFASYAVPWAVVVLFWFTNCQYNCLSTISQDVNPQMVAGSSTKHGTQHV